MKRIFHLFTGLAATLLLAGCLGYQLGGSRPEGVGSVYMATVINQTDEPAIELQVSQTLRQRIQFDGRMKLVNSEEDADAVIEVRLTNYQLSPIAYRKDRNTAPASYRLRITGVAELKDRETGKVLSSSKTYGEAIFEFVSDLTTSKRNGLAEASKDIANYMIDDLVETWQ